MHISNLSKTCYYHIRDLRRMRSTWTSILPAPSLHLWFILSLTTATLSTTFHSHNSSDSMLSKTPWLVASLPALGFQHITPGLKSLHWLKVEQRIQNKLISTQLVVYLQNDRHVMLTRIGVIQKDT